jgi:hypothetical protein
MVQSTSEGDAGGAGLGFKAVAFATGGLSTGAQAAGAGIASVGTMADATSFTVDTSRYASNEW